MNKKLKISYLFASLTVLFWSTSATAFKIALKNQTYIQILFLASLFSFLFFLFLVLFSAEKRKSLNALKLKDLLFLSLMGFLNPFVYYLMIFKSYDLLPAQVAQPLNFIWPIVLVLLSVPLLGQKLNLKTIPALLLSFIGVFFISSQGEFLSIQKSSSLGVFLALSSSVVWASFWIFNVKSQIHAIVKLFISFGFSAVYALLLMLLSSNSFEFSTNGILSIAYISIFEMGITFVIWMTALKLAGETSKISNFIYLVPFGSVVVVKLVLNESIYLSTIIGIVLILTGIIIQEYKFKKHV